MSVSIGDHKVVITQDGFVGVKESENDKEVLDVLNTLFGSSILIGHSFEGATQNDLMEINIDNDDQIEEKYGELSLRRRHASPHAKTGENYNRLIGGRPSVERKLIDVDYIDELFSLAQRIYQDDEMKERVGSALQAYTHHVNGEYTQAYLLAWISIEQYINTRLNEYLKTNKDVNSERRQNMQRGGHWGASHLIEIMEISDCVSKDKYNKMDDMRKRRNEIVHKTESASKEESALFRRRFSGVKEVLKRFSVY